MLVMLSGHGQELKVKVRGPDGREVERDDGFYCPGAARSLTNRTRWSRSATRPTTGW